MARGLLLTRRRNGHFIINSVIIRFTTDLLAAHLTNTVNIRFQVSMCCSVCNSVVSLWIIFGQLGVFAFRVIVLGITFVNCESRL